MVEFRGLVMPRWIVRRGWFVGLFPHGQVGICIRTADGYPIGYGFAICAKEQKNGLVVDFDLFPIESTGGGDGAADELRLHHHLPMLPPTLVFASFLSLGSYGAVVECPEPTIYPACSAYGDKCAVANDDDLLIENPHLIVICCTLPFLLCRGLR